MFGGRLKNLERDNDNLLLRDVLPYDIINMTRSYYNTTKEGKKYRIKKYRIKKARENLYLY